MQKFKTVIINSRRNNSRPELFRFLHLPRKNKKHTVKLSVAVDDDIVIASRTSAEGRSTRPQSFGPYAQPGADWSSTRAVLWVDRACVSPGADVPASRALWGRRLAPRSWWSGRSCCPLRCWALSRRRRRADLWCRERANWGPPPSKDKIL